VAKHHGVLFYVAAPFTSIDFSIPSGEHIVIEERPEREMSHVADHRIAAPGFLFFSQSSLKLFDMYSYHKIFPTRFYGCAN
jgi:methylthioribose-1-phosphate isomerase